VTYDSSLTVDFFLFLFLLFACAAGSRNKDYVFLRADPDKNLYIVWARY